MKDKRLRIINYGIAVLVLAAVAYMYGRLPEQIPTNWGLNGQVTYGSKTTIWMLAGMVVLMAFMFDVMPHIDPRKQNYTRFGKIYDYFCVGMQLFLAVTVGIVLSESFYPGRIAVSKVIVMMLAILFLLLGNYMPKVQSNFYFGVKTPWALSDEEVWRKTHRLAGKLYVLTGICLLISSFLLTEKITFAVLMVSVLGSSLAASAASYYWWRKRESNKN